MTDRDDIYGISSMTYLAYNNKYLLVRYGLSFDVYDITKDFEYKAENQSFYGNNNELLIYEFLCNFEEEYFLARGGFHEYKFFKYQNNVINEYKKFPFSKENMKGIIKMKNNKFIVYTEKEIILFKKID